MKPSSAAKKISRKSARNATLMNLLGTPGLGSLMVGRKLTGATQLLVFLVGFVLFCVWSVTTINHALHQILSDSENPPSPSPGGNMALLGVILCVIAWLWSLLTSLSLLRDATKTEATPTGNFTMKSIKLDETEIQAALAAMSNWHRNGQIISRKFQFKDFPAALKFVNAVGKIAERDQHHPDIDIRWNKVMLALTTHDAGGLTEKDFALAQKIDRL